MVDLIFDMQDGAYSENKYQTFRNELTDICHADIAALSYNIMSVRLKKEYVEKFNKADSFDQLTEKDRGELKNHIAPLVSSTEKDEYAKQFDNFMYGFMIADIEHLPTRAYMKNQLCQAASLLENKANIPQIQQKINLIKDIQTDDFWQDISILTLDSVRDELRYLIQFLNDGGGRKKIFTKLSDPAATISEGKVLDAAYDFEDYRKKVNRYVEEHKNEPAIYMRLNIQLYKCQ